MSLPISECLQDTSFLQQSRSPKHKEYEPEKKVYKYVFTVLKLDSLKFVEEHGDRKELMFKEKNPYSLILQLPRCNFKQENCLNYLLVFSLLSFQFPFVI